MDGKANVKSIMAKFSNNPTEEVHSRQVKVVGQPSLVTKPPFEPFPPLKNASASARPGSSLQKSASFKPPLGNKPAFQETSDKDPKPPPLKINPVTNKFAALASAASKEVNEKPGLGFPKPLGPKPIEPLKDVSKPGFPKAPENKLPGYLPSKHDLKPPGLKPAFKPEPQEAEVKLVPSKVAGVKGIFNVPSQENDPRPPFLKPIPREKPSPHPNSNEGIVNKSKNAFLNQTPPGSLGPKPKLNSVRSPRDAEKKSNDGTDSTAGHFPGVALKPVMNQSSTPQILPQSDGQRNEETRRSVTKNIIFQMNQQDSGSASGAAAAKFGSSSRVASTGHWTDHSEKEEKDKDLPKRKALPPPFKLGPPPQKPKRPPTVDLKRFQKDHGDSSKKPRSVGLPPPVLPSISVAQATVPQPPPPPPPPGSHPSAQVPVLPPRNIKPKSDIIDQENEETYDDLDSEGPGNADESDEELETYEDIDEMRTPSRDDERKKQKEEKKKSDQEKKEQKKKEQEIRKKFKLVGPIEVIHQARACTDFKGGKNDLAFKQGDKIEIIRITDNPEGKWLGRTRGSYGYIKTTMVEIDYDSLKRKPRPPTNILPRQSESDKEVYDDVGDRDSISSGGQSGGGFPPPPADIYDGVEEEDDIQTRSVSQEDEDKNNTWPRGLLKILKGKDYQKKSVRETTPKVNVTEANGSFFRPPSARQPGKDSADSDGDVYDDVEPSDFPPPPKEISLGINPKSLSAGRGKSDERDSQKLKKMEKEFRKKFKYEGDIRVLYTTTVNRAPSPKKRGSKDLLVKAGESIDVIQNVDNSKLLCRNEEGKYGYVRKSCILDEDEEIYDDIADDGCIYDND